MPEHDETQEEQSASGVWNCHFIWAALGLAIASLCAFSIDLQVAQFFRQGHFPGDLQKMVSLSEVFAHGFGATWLIITVYVLCPEMRRKVLRLTACSLFSGALASFLKLIVSRNRPGTYEQLPESIFNTFSGTLPWLNHEIEEPFDHAIQSIPSGHAAAAVGLAIGLTWLFPRGRWLFSIFAVLAMLQRIESQAHFPSDTLLGAACAFFVCFLVLKFPPTAKFYNWFESRGSAGAGQEPDVA